MRERSSELVAHWCAALATSRPVLAAEILLVQREAFSLSLCLSFSLSLFLFVSRSLIPLSPFLTSTSLARRKALSFSLSLSLSGPAGLTARGRPALLAGGKHHRHGALFLLVRGKKNSLEAQLLE